jgi:uncharacterized protein (TIGR04141 family)
VTIGEDSHRQIGDTSQQGGSMTIEKITIYKIKSGTGTTEEFVTAEGLQLITLPEDVDCPDVVVTAWACMKVHSGIKKTQDNIPWLTFLNDGFPEEKRFIFEAKNSFPAGLVILKFESAVECSFYALTFGLAGDSLINHEYVVRDFGLRVAMNICDPDKLKRIQTSIHESVSTQSERQISVGSSFSVFNIDDEKEFLRTVAGTARNEFSFVQSFTGRDNIAIKAAKGNSLTWKTLVERVHKLGEAHQLDKFKTHFPGYAKFHFENDPVIIASLDALLFQGIKADVPANIHLAAPEVLDFGSVEFTYNSNIIERYDDLVLAELLASRRAFGDKSSIDSIKGLRVNVWNLETAQKIREWSAYKCLVAELEYDGDSFILSNSQWKRVSQELKDEVTEYIKSVPLNVDQYLLDKISIWDAVSSKNKEAVFNVSVADRCDDIVLFDTAKIEIAGKRLYETCDLFHKEKKFIQVKRYSSGSASVSHLFVQGRFYAEAFLSDDKCREGMRQHIEAVVPIETKDEFLDLVPLLRANVVANTYTVLFCILSDSDPISIDDLPFMARYELMHTHRHLQRVLGMNCEVAFRAVLTGPPAVAPAAPALPVVPVAHVLPSKLAA